ncbi:MAG TPA: 2-dehydropantoate 2-reductase [Solirubrobacterales bacterium]|jgi:2-dehydropantoate 2-reductase|nr:2-dehydropantoate 2-reductase [Solirubrobacterales bacterium]
MRFAVLGAGAMGSLFGGRLDLAGHEVTLIDPWRDHVEAVRRDGLTLSWDGGSLLAHPDATTNAAEVGPVDAVIVLTKGYALAESAAALRPAVGGDAWIVPLMNGIGHDRTLGAIFTPEQVVPGTTLIGAEMVGPAHTRMSDYTAAEEAVTHLGPPRTTAAIPAGVVEIAAALSDAHLPTEALDDVDEVIWTKLSLASSMGPLSALMRRTIKDIWEDQAANAVFRSLYDEIVDVAAAEGVSLERERLWNEQHAPLCASSGDSYSSMAWDVMKGRPTEIESFLLEVARRGEKHGVPTPVGKAVGLMIKGLETPPSREDGDALAAHPDLRPAA